MWCKQNYALIKLVYWFIKVQSKERDIQKSKDIKQNFDSRIQDVSEKLKAVSAMLKEKATDITQAKEETKVCIWK